MFGVGVSVKQRVLITLEIEKRNTIRLTQVKIHEEIKIEFHVLILKMKILSLKYFFHPYLLP